MLTKKYKGFTLIELLVVIAIIGILSSIVLVSVNSARNKAKDVAIKEDIVNMRVAAEMYYDDPTSGDGDYTGFCTDSGTYGGAKSIAAADSTNGAGDVSCNESTTGNAWAACADLLADAANSICVDFVGNSKTMANATCVSTWTATVCP